MLTLSLLTHETVLILCALWEAEDDSPSPTQIASAIPSMTYQTVYQRLGKLTAKGIVKRHDERGNAWFSPLYSRQEVMTVLMNSAYEIASLIDRPAVVRKAWKMTATNSVT